MKQKNLLLYIIILCSICFAGGIYVAQEEIIPELTESVSAKLNYSLCFTPKQRCESLILNKIRNAKQEILIQAYSFTSKPIATELIKAKNRGINVQIIADKSQKKARGSQIYNVQKNSIPVFIDFKPAIAHNKIMIIDEKSVITGSYNFTYSAEHRNTENLIFLNENKAALSYKKNWLDRKNYSSDL